MAKVPDEKAKQVEEAIADIMKKINDISPEIEIEIKRSGSVKADHFSDWHDRFKDGDRFNDGFGKA